MMGERISLRSIIELITDRQKRFVVITHLLKYIYKLIGRPLTFEESRLIEALLNVESIKRCYAQVDVFGKPFYFDLLRLSFNELMSPSLMKRICEKDCYLFQSLNVSDPVVFDIGAHIGVFSRYVLALKPDAKVYAFEPDKENFDVLKLNLSKFSNAFSFQKGVFNKKDSIEFYVSRKIDWRSSLLINEKFRNRFDPGELSTSYKVELIDIDSFVRENGIKRVDLLKITIPGEIEHLALSGAVQTIEKFRPQVSVTVYKKNVSEVKSFFEMIGGYYEVSSPFPPSPSSPTQIRIFKPTKI